jgi:hypothetical protein
LPVHVQISGGHVGMPQGTSVWVVSDNIIHSLSRLSWTTGSLLDAVCHAYGCGRCRNIDVAMVLETFPVGCHALPDVGGASAFQVLEGGTSAR